MATLFSNELRAVVVPENIFDNPQNVLKENCLSVQHFDYQCEHKRNASNEIYGPTDTVILKFTVRLNSPKHARVFYQNLVSNDYYDYSFLFNSTYNAFQRLENFEDGMVVNGYVVNVEEDYCNDQKGTGEYEQVLLHITLLARSVVYLGSEAQKNFKSIFIQ
jgi:hypothetical protein